MTNNTAFKFKPFSCKQRKILNWWTDDSPVKDYDGIIADGAIRSGKSLTMSLSFVLWAMSTFSAQNFAMCGKTVGSFRKNVLVWLKQMLNGRGYEYEDKRADNLFIVRKNNVENYFYIYGGKDERSQDLIQGITLAGLYLDEVVLMPESFVNQATGRCSVENSKMWFNCNPSSPAHWFKIDWIDEARHKNLLYLHFKMDDNLSLSEKIKNRYRSLYTGVFYKRFILGLWVLAEGVIYPEYENAIAEAPEGVIQAKALSIDYGTQNPFAALLWYKINDIWYAVDEYYYSGRETAKQKTDDEYKKDLEEFVLPKLLEGEKIETIIDPSAASFIALLKKCDWCRVRSADNAVEDGIRETSSAMYRGLIKFSPRLKNWEREMQSYVWEDGTDKPVKENDHLADSMRYFVKTKHIARVNRKIKRGEE